MPARGTDFHRQQLIANMSQVGLALSGFDDCATVSLVLSKYLQAILKSCGLIMLNFFKALLEDNGRLVQENQGLRDQALGLGRSVTYLENKDRVSELQVSQVRLWTMLTKDIVCCVVPRWKHDIRKSILLAVRLFSNAQLV
jgi:hypothetical protein